MFENFDIETFAHPKPNPTKPVLARTKGKSQYAVVMMEWEARSAVNWFGGID